MSGQRIFPPPVNFPPSPSSPSRPRTLSETLVGTGLPSPPASPTRAPAPGPPSKRRRELSESEENEGPMTIEAYLYRTDPYRSTDLRPLWPLPLVREKCDEIITTRLNSPQGLRLREQVIACLKDHGIATSNFNVFSCTKPSYARNQNQLILKVDVAVTDLEPTDKWSSARRGIGKCLSNFGFDNIKVEILDESRAFVLSLLPIDHNSVAVKAYKQVEEEILRLLERKLTMEWTTMSLYRVKRPGLDISNAVVIMVKPYTHYDWNILKVQVGELLSKGYDAIKVPPYARPTIEVEVTPGVYTTLPPEDDKEPESIRSALDLQENLTAWPKMGEGIGFSNKDGGGTLGGFFKLHVGNQVHWGILTNYHVVDRSETPDSLADAFGTAYGSRVYSTQLVYPTREDVRLTLGEIQKELPTLSQALKDSTAQKKEREWMGLSTRRQNMEIAHNEPEYARLEALEKLCQQMPKVLGNVLVSSGRALSHRKEVLDWAFVEMSSIDFSRVQNMNCLPVVRDFETELDKKQSISRRDLGQAGPRYNNRDPQYQIQGFTDVQRGQWYFKIGRTSGITTGICNGVENNSNISHYRQVYDEFGRPLNVVYCKRSSDWVILNCDPLGAAAQREFCKPGDSGSLIIDSNGYCAGILFGSLRGFAGPLNKWGTDYADCGTVTTMSTVQKSIAKKTAYTRRVIRKNEQGREIAEMVHGGVPDGILSLGHL